MTIKNNFGFYLLLLSGLLLILILLFSFPKNDKENMEALYRNAAKEALTKKHNVEINIPYYYLSGPLLKGIASDGTISFRFTYIIQKDLATDNYEDAYKLVGLKKQIKDMFLHEGFSVININFRNEDSFKGKTSLLTPEISIFSPFEEEIAIKRVKSILERIKGLGFDFINITLKTKEKEMEIHSFDGYTIETIKGK